jgi:cellobiose phosphorylase
VRWHAYTRGRGLNLDLVILDERPGDAGDRLGADLQGGVAGPLLGKPGGVFVLAAEKIPADDRMLLAAAARAVLGGGRGPLTDQIDRRPPAAPLGRPPIPGAPIAAAPAGQSAMPPEGLKFWNGHGGFTPDGREYVIVIDDTARGGPALPPAPWTNVLANPGFGCLVTEAGLGYSWAGNSQMNRLTPWSNDPVSDPPGEVVYLRDEETGAVWTPTPLPRGPAAAVTVRHGQGYTRYTHRSCGLDQELLVLVPPDDPVKLLCLTVRNAGDQPRRLSATFYAEWVLGGLRDNAPLQVVCESDAAAGAILARSAWAGEFAGRPAFAAAGSRLRSATADRAEFLGRHGTTSAPAALGRGNLSGRAAPALDPCAALMTEIVLAPGQTDEVVFVVGQAETLEQVRPLVDAYTAPGRAEEALAEVQRLWDRTLGAVQVETPDAGLDLMVNRWLLYQVLACRVWGRSAFYQSGGAYGFRDQLQDVMALVHSSPEHGAGADPAVGVAAVRGRRRAALVAPALRHRRPHAHHRRPVLPAPGRPPLRDRDWRRRPARRVGAFPQVPGAAAQPGRGLRLAGRERPNGNSVRALRARPGVRLPTRAAWLAPYGDRRLERRHEQGRRWGQG